MTAHPQQKLKPGQERFPVFMANVGHRENDMANEIHYKGHKMPKFIAWRKFLSYFRMIQDPNITIVEVENKPIPTTRLKKLTLKTL